MSLPLNLGRVGYQVAGTYVYRGQLVITTGVMYYFPLKDLKKSKVMDEGALLGGMMGGIVGGALSAGAKELNEAIPLFARPVLDLTQVLLHAPSDRAVQETFDAHIAEFRGYKPQSSDDLPIPSRYAGDKVKNLSLTSLGRLRFETEFDEHVFKIGLIKKGKLRQALAESGFLS